MIRRSLPLAAAALALALVAPAGPAFAQTSDEVTPPMHDLYGTVRTVRGDVLTLELRTGRTLTIDLREARALHHDAVLLTPGRPVHVRGNPVAGGFHAFAVLKSHADRVAWPPDR
jgi:hypothetical protein